MGNVIKIDDGTRTYDIQNKQGKLLCTFSFNPYDGGLVNRYKEVSNNLNVMASNLDKENISEEEKYLKAESFIKEQYNYLFNSDVEGSFFSVLSPLTLMPNGSVFAEHVMEVIADTVKKESGVALEKVKIRIEKHTKKYHR